MDQDYTFEKSLCKRFIQEFREVDGGRSALPKYVNILQEVSNRRTYSVDIQLGDLQDFAPNDEHYKKLVHHISTNTVRYIYMFSEVADELLPPSNLECEGGDTFDILMRQREQAEQENTGESQDIAHQLPALLRRRYRIYIHVTDKHDVLQIRNIRAANIGSLVKFKGICTRVGDVKPLLEVACFTCDCCGFEIYQEVAGDNFNPIAGCPSRICSARGSSEPKIFLETRASKFVKYQEVRIQELPEDVPVGHIPRSLTVQVKGELTRSMGPGDRVEVTGVFLPKPHTGFKVL